MKRNRVLLVDDNDAIRKLGTIYLNNVVPEAVVDTAGDYQTAWGLYQEHRDSYRACVIDGVFPGGGGLKLARAIRDDSNSGYPRINIFTGDGEDTGINIEQEAEKEGFPVFIKPYYKPVAQKIKQDFSKEE